MTERVQHLGELIRHSCKATLVVASDILNEELDSDEAFKTFRDSLDYLENDDHVTVTQKRLNDEYTEITLTVRKLINVEDITGLIKTEEPTNSVELKKELYK